MASEPLTSSYRSAAGDVVALAVADLLATWRTFDLTDVLTVQRDLTQLLTELLDGYGAVLGSLTADWYENVRDEAGVPGTFNAQSITSFDTGRVESLAGYSTSPLSWENPDLERALASATGGLQKILIEDAGEDVIANSSRDPRSTGWKRVTSADACKFCVMLAGRGAVYSADTCRFASHDHCKCSAEPAFGEGISMSVVQFAASSRRQTEADKARVRAYLATL